MGYQFSNNWPYSSTVFPSMDDHTDPVNNVYFTGLHEEVQRIQFFLGLHPQGAYANVKARLDNFRAELGINPQEGWNDIKAKLEGHRHRGGLDGALLDAEDQIYTESGVNFLSNWTNIGGPGDYGKSFNGFAYYDLIYCAPTEQAITKKLMYWFRTGDQSYGFQELTLDWFQPRGSVVSGNFAWVSVTNAAGKVFKINIDTWEETEITIGAGNNNLGDLVALGDYIYGVSSTSPAVVVRIHKTTDAVSTWTMDAGEDTGDSIDTDGTFIWFTVDTDPIKLIKFNPSTGTHTTFDITGINPPCKFLTVYNNYVWMFVQASPTKVIRFSIDLETLVIYDTNWPNNLICGKRYGARTYLNFYNAAVHQAVIFDFTNMRSWITDSVGYGRPPLAFAITNGWGFWELGDPENDQLWMAQITEPS